MYNNVIKTTLLFMVCLVITSCTSLKSKHYVGERELPKEADFRKETIWQFNDKVFYLRAVDSENITASTLDWDNEKKEYIVKNRQYSLLYSTSSN